MVSYSEERREACCKGCGATNHVIVAYAGDYRANERETARCYECGVEVDADRCFAIFAAASAAEAEALLRSMQNRR